MSTYSNQVKDSASTQENLNPSQSVIPLLKKTNETLLLEESYSIKQSNNVSDMAIWDNPNTTWDGVDTDDEWDSYSDSGKINILISNPKNIFIERFGFDLLKGSLNTATWDTTNKRVDFTSGQICHIESAYLDTIDNVVITGAKLTVTIDSGSFDLEVSADGGSNWETVTNGVSFSFSNTGYNLQIKITENNTSTGRITKILCEYNT